MDVILLTYELLNPASIKNRETIEGALKKVSKFWWHHLSNVWILADHGLTVEGMYDTVKIHFALSGKIPSDNLLIVRIDPSVARGYLDLKGWDWFKKIRELSK